MENNVTSTISTEKTEAEGFNIKLKHSLILFGLFFLITLISIYPTESLGL